MAVIGIDMPDLMGEPGPFTLFLRKRDGTLVGSGFTFSETVLSSVPTGRFTGTVPDNLLSEDLAARFYEGTSETSAGILWKGWLPLGKTELQSEPPSASSGNAVTLQLGATIPMNLGQVTGLDQELVIGDSYNATVGRRIPVTLTDINGDPIPTTFGSKSLADNGTTITMLLHPVNARNTESVTAAAQGACEFVPLSGQTPAMLWVSLNCADTAQLSPGEYTVQFNALWTTGETVTLAWKGRTKFVRRLKRA